MSGPRDYWEECIAISFEENNISATDEQIKNVAGDVEASHDNAGMAFGHHCIPDPRDTEIATLKTALKNENDKIICPQCKGSGGSRVYPCWKCHGEGRRLP